MLVLSRKPGQDIRINEDIVVRVVQVAGGRVRLGVAAPANIRIARLPAALALSCVVRGDLACRK